MGTSGVVVAPVVSARTNSLVVAGRSAGSVAMPWRIASSMVGATVGRIRRTLGAGSLKRRAMTACAVGPVNGGSPASISYRTAARL